MSKTIFSQEILKEKCGTQCINCKKEEDIQYHHIVPLALGGQDILSNIVPLCSECHSLIHFGNKNHWNNHSEATKRGIQKAKMEGKQIGLLKGTKLTTKKSLKAKEIIKKYSKNFNGTLENDDVMKIAEISRNTFYKYQKELRGELYGEHNSNSNN